MSKVICARVTVNGGDALVLDVENLQEFLKDEFKGWGTDLHLYIDSYSIDFCLMTQYDLENLPEHEGF